jgi:hypothetical protein
MRAAGAEGGGSLYMATGEGVRETKSERSSTLNDGEGVRLYDAEGVRARVSRPSSGEFARNLSMFDMLPYFPSGHAFDMLTRNTAHVAGSADRARSAGQRRSLRR